MQKVVSKDKTITAVLGMGKTGISVANYLSSENLPFVIWDCNPEVMAKFTDFQSPHPNTYKNIGVTSVILSPGINPMTNSACYSIKRQNIPIYSDFDLFAKKIKGQIVVVSGTNGKSTTVSLIDHIFKNHGFRCALGGNVGYPLTDLNFEQDFYVIELSSYQLDISSNLHSDISLLLNITPDHLDRHLGFEGYVEAKRKIFENSTLCVMNIDDPVIQNIYRLTNTKKIGFSAKNSSYIYKDPESGEVIFTIPEIISDIPAENILGALIVAKIYGISNEEVLKSTQSFCRLKHRNQMLGKIGNTTFINDSKSTNIESTLKALEVHKDKKIILICGGLAKTYNIDELFFKYKNIKKIYLIGSSTEDFAGILSGKIAFEKSFTLQNAFQSSFIFSQNLEESVILLSPACSSFDQWQNFEERGDAFISLFLKMRNKDESINS